MINLTGNENISSPAQKKKGWGLKKLTNWRRDQSESNPIPHLENLVKTLDKRFNQNLKQLPKMDDRFSSIKGFQFAIANLCNANVEIGQALDKKELITEDVAILLLDEEIAKTETILQMDIVAKSAKGFETAVFTYNQLFITKQKIKSEFGVPTPLRLPEYLVGADVQSLEHQPKMLPSKTQTTQRMVIHVSVLSTLHKSLFPAERMIVIAGIRKDNNINIGRIYDVTGVASSGHVRANADLLGRALVEMEESDTYFAFWVHSHPGIGGGATHPSSTDLNQEQDWLKDFSPDLVNAIMVKDGCVRFWGKSIEEKRVVVEIVGHGVEKLEENIYRLIG